MATKEITFRKPPINEVVLGVLFRGGGFTPADYGLFWQMIRKNYPKIASAPTLISTRNAEAAIPVSDLWPRAWFLSQDEKTLVQVQRDRFHFNWRRLADLDEYPRFDSFLPEFINLWTTFLSTENMSSRIEVASFELTYINHIDGRMGWTSGADTGKLFRFLPNDHLSKAKVQTAEVTSTYDFADLGTLKVTARHAVKLTDSQPLLVLDLTMNRRAKSSDPLKIWFDRAHKELVNAFSEMTTETAHKLWERQ